MNAPPAAVILLALAVVFAALSLQDYLKAEGKLTAARKTWLRVAFLFAGISIALTFWQLLGR
ncbi:MAG: hypothetical protein ABMA01_02475 [Chthoniobacteraceae bacterium]